SQASLAVAAVVFGAVSTLGATHAAHGEASPFRQVEPPVKAYPEKPLPEQLQRSRNSYSVPGSRPSTGVVVPAIISGADQLKSVVRRHWSSYPCAPATAFHWRVTPVGRTSVILKWVGTGQQKGVPSLLTAVQVASKPGAPTAQSVRVSTVIKGPLEVMLVGG